MVILVPKPKFHMEGIVIENGILQRRLPCLTVGHPLTPPDP